ncbi:hypothetical protein DFJ58DRAFT_839485 [Suillus subalutaceus]|uniref:uncharacterized protein n=1 Tax=Suillus subalutaceus TaxID=48586 RepID=UPI001B86FDBA|nr:uncharacterized protein DFJ58DRAFT_839485 [Suillus subalutaceus]KAG1862059.1 hypothetical protein DFJ58DRAFT_839485 [Suillus subalutaceus]
MTHPHLQVEKEHEMGNNHTSARGRSTVPRGGKSARRRRARAVAEPDRASHVELRVGEYDDDAEDVTQSRSVLITMKFRHVCNVSEGKSWPASADEECINEMTGERYLMPEFTKTVNDDHNRTIFAKVASLVWQDLQNMANSDCLVNRKVKWNKQSLFTFAKETYHGFKEDWRAQNDAEKKAAKEKADWLMTARQAYIEKFSVDPVDLVHADHMSDEASGPDDDELEDGWKQRMAEKMGMPANSQVKNLSFLEVTRVPGDLTNTDRQSQRIPDFTPYTFGINTEWLKANKDRLEYQDLLKEWGAWEDPEGFGSKKREHQDDQGTPNDEVDQDNTRGREG